MLLFAEFGLSLGLLYLGICLLLFVVQRRIIFEPQFQPENPIPDDLAIAYETKRLATGSSDTEDVVSWWFPGEHSNGKTILFLHGNSGYEDCNFETLKLLNQLGFNVLMLNYRGYGASTPVFPNEARVYEDAAVGYHFLLQQKQVEPKNLLIYGHSLGGAIATELATRYDCAGLFLESTFASMVEMSITKAYMQVFPINWILNQRFDSRRKLPLLNIPIFLCHGTVDDTVPSFMSERLMAIANEPKRLELIEGAGHHDLICVDTNTVSTGIQWLCQQLQWQI
ncbi:alpha/beta hydrolase fold protein [[Leptolyngbya] sp. PCC 7376]|uniref:alpha/beta hydrolase n=1 Tax=[Leptolyngbya] sp. PCC 7376 TaxID=111781 RepID=UPI00029EDB4D|nr:alpha/beta hydrolase [[Leptolyngbya] sp. PCC 7376]AFY39024.1 alpha/beta hydrolase fold protein [[Leptolyngbya] sp. PCC 7376]